MPAPFFTTNDSEIGRLEGLYIKERNPPAQVSGAFLGVVGIVGECIRGPIDTPVEITSEGRFKAVFGSRDQGSGGSTIGGKVWLSMLNKPFGKVVVVRAAAAAATVAKSTLDDVVPTSICRLEATSAGAWGGNVTYTVANATDGDSNHFDLAVTYLGNTVTYRNIDLHNGTDNSLAIIGDDIANYIKLVKLTDGRPLNAASQTLGVSGTSPTAGSDGTIADSDFTASLRGTNQVKAYAGVGVVFIAERSSSTLKSDLHTDAAASSDRLFLMGADAATTSLSSAVTDVASYRDDRVVYCFNHTYTLDPETATSVLVQPTSWMASILSQTDVDIHPGEEDTKQFTAGIQALYNENYTREDYISLKEAGICGLEKDDGFAFVSGVVTDLTSGKTEITRRRSTDYIQLSLATELKHSVKKKNTRSQRDSNLALISGFLSDLAEAERVVDKLDDGTPAFSLDVKSVNTDQGRASGVERILMQVKLIDHMLALVLETEIGNGVKIVEVQ